VDAASPARGVQAAEVNKVLAEIGAAGSPQLVVWNKIDAARLEPSLERDQYGRISRVFVSARTGAGLEALRGAIAELARLRAAERGAAASRAHAAQPHQ
jgi:GTP-binding protein HflX